MAEICFDVVDLLTLDPDLEGQAHCWAIIETPQGSRSKYDYDPKSGLFRLAAVLPAGMAFPLSFGFVPGTVGGDGDPLDLVVLSDETLAIGVLVRVTLLGAIEAEQTQGHETFRNDRLVAKVAESHSWADIADMDQLGAAFTEDLLRFFETYNELRSRDFRLLKLSGPPRAAELIRDAQRKAAASGASLAKNKALEAKIPKKILDFKLSKGGRKDLRKLLKLFETPAARAIAVSIVGAAARWRKAGWPS